MLVGHAGWGSRRYGGEGRDITDAEAEEEEEGDGVGAQAPVEVALLGLLGSVVHLVKGVWVEGVTRKKSCVP